MNCARKRPLTDAELEQILLEDLPLDNAEYTDSESDDDDDGITTANNTNNFDAVFDNMLKDVEDTENENIVSNISEDNGSIVSTSTKEILEEDIESNNPSTTKKKNISNEPNRKWEKRNIITDIPEYLEHEGLSDDFSDCATVTDVFLKVLGTAISDITYESNLYATQKGKNLNLQVTEMNTFIGIVFFMSYHRLPRWRDYWSTAIDMQVPFVSSSMTRKRFEEILRFLHVNDNSSIPKDNKNKVYKIQPLIDTLNFQFRKLYKGTRKLSVDESIILFKGRTTLKQYNPMKPIKRGYKVWCLADQKGYILKFQVYQGKNEELEKKFEKYGLGERVVLALTEEVWNQHRIIYFDNYFTSIALLERLKIENTLACGTIRSTRSGFPKNLASDKKMKRGDYDYRYSNTDVGVYKWRDNKIVHFATNFHGNEETSVQRKEKDGTSKPVKCPVLVKDYNINMGGVDHADQLRMSYGINRKAKKWWHRLFWGFIEIAFVNSYILSKEIFEEERNTTLLDYRRRLCQGLITSNDNRYCKKRSSTSSASSKEPLKKKRKYNYSVSNEVRLGNKGVHWPKFLENRGRCEMCSSRAVQSRPYSKCSTCGVFLCCNKEKNCFLDYHNIEVN